uniref:Acb2/Tad1 hairpin domain-containing protein n=1 Tax=viral metagenome TaxID=1070528 RepID=A0A6H1ZBR5_9ZZZZ
MDLSKSRIESCLDLEAIFTYHAPRGTQVQRYPDIRDAGKRFAQTILDNTPGSAEQTLAVRAVQQAVMWANAAIAIHE